MTKKERKLITDFIKRMSAVIDGKETLFDNDGDGDCFLYSRREGKPISLEEGLEYIEEGIYSLEKILEENN